MKDEDKAEMVGIARGFEEMGIELFATSGTCDALNEAGIECKRVNRVSQAHPNILDMIQSGTVDLIINTPPRAASTTPTASRSAEGIIFTGGPNSVYLEDSPTIDPEIFNWGIPCWESATAAS